MAEPAFMVADLGILIATATVLSILARKTRQPKIVAYIVTGLLLGPAILNLVGETSTISLMSELGLPFLLFLLGIELRFDEVKPLLKPVLKISALQMILTGGLGFFIARFFAFDVLSSVIIGFAVMYGSTAVIVKLLTEKGEHATVPGKIDIGVLLVQDIVVIILLAVVSSGATDMASLALNVFEFLLLTCTAGAITVLAVRHLLPQITKIPLQDIQTFLVHGIAWLFVFLHLAAFLDLSMEIGAFLAGLALGQLPYRTEFREQIRPLTALFVAIFFITIGLGMNHETLLLYWKEAVLASLILMIGKFTIMFGLTNWQGFLPETSFKSAINMTQTSEFSIVLASIALSQGYISEGVLGFISLVALLTMGASSYLISYNDQIYARFRHLLDYFHSEEKSDVDVLRLEEHAIVVGYNEVVDKIVPLIKDQVDDVVVVDRDPLNEENIDELDCHYIFGDFVHAGIREAAGLERARVIISFSRDMEANMKILEEKPSEALTFLRASDREEAGELYDVGADFILRKDALAAEEFIDTLETYVEEPGAFLRTASDTYRQLGGEHSG